MSEAQKRNWFSHAGFWGIVVAAALAFPMLGYSAPPVKDISSTATVVPPDSSTTVVPGSVASSADGSIMVVGMSVISGSSAGAAYVYVEPSGHKAWGVGVPTPVVLSNPSSSTGFGTSVAISSDGSRIIVGDPTYNGDSGAVWVFDEPTSGWAGASSVTEDKELASPAAGGKLGASVAISRDGNTVVAGAPVQQLETYTDAGDGYVFTYSTASSTWSGATDLAGLASFPLITSNDIGMEAGYSVAIAGNGTWAFVGAPFTSGAVYVYGSVMAFQHQSSGWTYKQTLTGDTSTDEHFGTSVASAGSTASTLVIGAPEYRTNAISFLGKAFIYEYNATSQTWALANSLTSATQASGEKFGQSVAISRDGTRIEIGSAYSNGVSGIVYQYDEPSKGKKLLGWSSVSSPTDLLTNAISGVNEGFAAAVAVGFTGRDTWVIGTANAAGYGAAYIFEGK